MNISILLLVFSILIFLSVLAGRAGAKFGIPTLLLFLGVGMLFGSDGLGIQFDNARLAQTIGMLALSIILFSGGMDTKYSEIRPVMASGLVLSTLGVVLTATCVGGFIYTVCDWFGFRMTLMESFLMGAVMSSTDSASVFSILRSKKQGLKSNLRPLLELESGSNDPMAYLLTIILLQVITGGQSAGVLKICSMLLMQMGIGAAAGYLLGRGMVWFINHLGVANQALYSVLLVSCVFFVFSLTDIMGGNGYLAVYLAGLVVGNKKIAAKRTVSTFMDGLTWLSQIVMFLTLGLLVNPSRLIVPGTVGIGLLVGVFMMIVARPVVVLLCMWPFRKQFSFRAMVYASWVGLRGAVPIIFATYPLVAVSDGFDSVVADMIFNVVFFITILSLAVQGSTVSWMAGLLGLSEDVAEESFGVELPDKIKARLTEIAVQDHFLSNGRLLKEIQMPHNTLVVMIHRGKDYFVPRGDTELHSGDRLLVISSDEAEVLGEIETMGLEKS